MKPADVKLGNQLRSSLLEFDINMRHLPGIQNQLYRECLIEQMIDSIRRIRYVKIILNKTSEVCTHPMNIAFDPFKAAVYFKKHGNINEAFWMVFLGTHFGKNKNSKWELVKAIYGALNSENNWTWERTSSDIDGFRRWLNENQQEIKGNNGFGNHRKYQSLGAYNERGTGSTIASYVDWIGEKRDHLMMINDRFDNEIVNDPKRFFNALYKSLSYVKGFGRTAKFDFLTMVGKIELLKIIPNSTYMLEATGPKRGAKLLFGGNINFSINVRLLETYLQELEEHLNLYFGMQVLEDSLCNWQKSPSNYVHFGG